MSRRRGGLFTNLSFLFDLRTEDCRVFVRLRGVESIGCLIVPFLFLRQDLIRFVDVVHIDVRVLLARLRLVDLNRFVDPLNGFHQLLHVLLPSFSFGVTRPNGIAQGLRSRAVAGERE